VVRMQIQQFRGNCRKIGNLSVENTREVQSVKESRKTRSAIQMMIDNETFIHILALQTECCLFK
jgi:hypothetical protein